MKCPKCNHEFEIENKKNYVKDKNNLQDYPNCFNNFVDCPVQPIDINFIQNKCKMCPYYQYSNFRKDKLEVKEIKENLKPKLTDKEKKLDKQFKDIFKTLTKEQQEELMKKIKL
jgi:pyruvate/2-oxoacid:ferredoxin oxidoreductase beta subunit